MRILTRREAIQSVVAGFAAITAQAQSLFRGQNVAASGFPAWNAGFNFRGTVGHVSDAADDVFIDGSAAVPYPTLKTNVTGTAVNVGYSAGTVSVIDRNVVDVRLSGINYLTSGTATFRIDLPAAGVYRIVLALGDENTTTFQEQVIIKDDGTTRATIAGSTGGGGAAFFDTNQVLHPVADWPDDNTTADLTFATTICNLVFGDGSNVCTWAHIHLTRIS